MAHRGIFYFLSLVLAVLLIISSGLGLLKPEIMYAKESSNWFLQSVGQDIINLVLVFPLLIITSLGVYKNNRNALLVWGGILAYLIYTFLIYCFAIHFNQLFVVYCLILGLSFYLFVAFLFTELKKNPTYVASQTGRIKITGIYFVVIASIFYLLWLAQIIPAIINGTVPEETTNAALVTNPVHVIDLSICLPGIFIVGISLLRKKSLGIFLTPVVLSFLFLMDLTIAGLMIILKWRGYPVNNIVLTVMLFLALFTIVLLLGWLKKESNQLDESAVMQTSEQ